MSSIYVNSQLHSAWKRRTIEIRQDFLSRVDSPYRTASRPSTSEPPPEEFTEVIRAVLPFMGNGVNSNVVGAIISGAAAGCGATTPSIQSAQYVGGLGCTPDNVLLTWPRDCTGAPLVIEEPFPFASVWSDSSDLPAHVRCVPDNVLGRVILTGYNSWVLHPRRVRSDEATEELIASNIHPREGANALTETLGLAMLPYCAGLRFTGCVRIATEQEVEHLFTEVIRPNSWLRSGHTLSWRDFFVLSGVNESRVDLALGETNRLDRTAGVQAPSTPSATNVPAQARPRVNWSSINLDTPEVVRSTSRRSGRSARYSANHGMPEAPAPQPANPQPAAEPLMDEEILEYAAPELDQPVPEQTGQAVPPASAALDQMSSFDRIIATANAERLARERARILGLSYGMSPTVGTSTQYIP